MKKCFPFLIAERKESERKNCVAVQSIVIVYWSSEISVRQELRLFSFELISINSIWVNKALTILLPVFILICKFIIVDCFVR